MSVVVEYAKSLTGGLVIGASAAGLFFTHRRLAGISGLLGGVLHPSTEREDWSWRAAFVAGLAMVGVLARVFAPELVAGDSSTSLLVLGGSGLLVGFGARLSGGCTSGHGICGLGRFSLRSLAATATFMLLGGVVVFAVRHIAAGAL